MSSYASVASPLFCHLHVPKTGGTTLNVLLERWFSGRFEILHHPDPRFVLDVGHLADRLSKAPALQCISTHYLRSFPAEIGGRPTYYFTILRDPLDRALSTVTFVRKYFDTFSNEHKDALSRIRQLSDLEVLKEWSGFGKPHDPTDKLTGNPVTQVFLGEAFRYDFASDRRSGEAAAARQCIDVLDRFFHVGDFACFEGSVRELARRLEKFDVSCEVDPLPTENVSKDFRKDMRWLEDGRAIVDAYLESVAVDSMVYRHFARRDAQSGVGEVQER